MDTNTILAELRAERDRLNQAIAAIEQLDSKNLRTRGERQDKANTAPERPRGRRRMSAAARARIAAAAKAMWARRRAAAAGGKIRGMAKAASAKKAAPVKKAVPARHMSAAVRKRLSKLAKQRWAARKKAARASSVA